MYLALVATIRPAELFQCYRVFLVLPYLALIALERPKKCTCVLYGVAKTLPWRLVVTTSYKDLRVSFNLILVVRRCSFAVYCHR